jgi:lambda repressor-like predicted transcriptional regulator
MNNTNIHIGELILQKLKKERLTVAWLASKVNKDPSNLRKTLKKKSMNSELLQCISKALHCSVFDIYEEGILE